MELSILVLDNDDKFIKRLKKLFLSNTIKYDLLSATKSEEIIDAASHKTPDNFIINTSVQGLDILEIIDLLKKNEATKYIPVLLVTGKNENDFLNEALSSGNVDYVRHDALDYEISLRMKIALYNNNFIKNLQYQLSKSSPQAFVAAKTSNSVLVINPSGEIEWVNEGFLNMYEYSLKEFKDQFEKELFDPDLNLHFKQSLKVKDRRDKNIVYERAIKTKSGKRKWVQTTLTPIIDNQTKIVNRVIAIETDITSLKETEQRLEEKNDHLLTITEHLQNTNEILENQRIEIEKQKQNIEEQRKISDDLLLNILPKEIANQLKRKGYAKSKNYKMVSVFFSDFVSFTKLSETMQPQFLIKELSRYFEKFDEVTEKHFIEKIKTIGDAYMCVGGLPLRNKSNPIDVVLASLEIQKFVNEQNEIKKKNNEPLWELRLGVHTGEVIAGVIGKKKFAYDIWGDTVNTASRIEQACCPGKVNVSGDNYYYIKDYFDCTYRGKIEAKNKGEIDMYYVNRIKPELSEDKDGIIPNEEFIKNLAKY